MARTLHKARSAGAAESKPCRLLELPAELRTRIYEFALFPTHNQPVTDAELARQNYRLNGFVPHGRTKPALARSTGYYDCYIWKRDRSDPTLQRPSLLAVNKQVRGEASEIFYSKAVFRVPLAVDLGGSFGVRMAQKWLGSLWATSSP
ncbi:hypothetical protein CLAFUW4_00442 [Fulvia fulva]|uniref:Uncharacterized protein n=1 Tax=Passalora fulva TaxID=5499 RepID=A0A9Q8L892_PASFU|nr:uncharacterized protein CLAFUR5_00444 [Fulvia fulva]KAK4636124.1 hypothetical protein CLAFUR4_00442 [Fulvia fulva]KAK4637237.1 hypothetical protein CLAFUR0_00443 [Fulvia fulva]UJO11993.1 hypothetical protein CLAFUR5_00444 [Fulvia fulva]WPV08780.1 hypothetical protein CLAFUW4_00442 [Fulvia fulva]WPV24564.1 hypothetical protein CLAFUW7_00446 [Fulvia fulva]